MDQGRRLPEGCITPHWPTEEELGLWRQHGGSTHGPNVETVTMPLAFFGAFVTTIRLRGMLTAAEIADRVGRDGMGDAVAQKIRAATIKMGEGQ